MNLIDKEVRFDYYCPRCVFYKTSDAEDPCDRCLEYPSNQNSHKPVEYKPAKGHEKDILPLPTSN